MVPLTPASSTRASFSTTVETSPVDSPPETPRPSQHATAMQVVDRLRVANPNQKLPLPTVAVAGAQSAGKSSFLSALLDIPLYSDVGTATFGPTEIHSRFKTSPFSATIEIEYLFDNNGEPGRRRMPFTGCPIFDKQDLLRALRWAGDEARRCSAKTKIRTYEELDMMSEEEISAGRDKLSTFTFNKVILWAEGPEQRDISAMDLPGLGNRHKEQLASLYHDVLNHDEYIIVMVFSMSGDDPQSNLPVIEAVNRVRPQMQNVLGILTKADMANKKNKIAKTAWARMVVGDNEAMDCVKPQHEWHPLWLWDADEVYDEGLAKEEWIAEQRMFFQRPELKKWAEECGRPLGWEPTSERIYKLFSDLVVSQVPVIKNRIDCGLEHVCQGLSELPPEVDSPSSLMHDAVIAPVAQELMQSFERRSSRIQKLLAPLQGLQIKLADSIEKSYPLKDVKVRDKVSTARAAKSLTSQETHIFTTIDSKLKEYRNVRDGSRPDVALAVHEMTKSCLDQWSGFAHDANVQAWGALSTIVEAVVKGVTGSRPRIVQRATGALLDLRQAQESSVRDYISSIMSKELERQDLTDDNSRMFQEADAVADLCEAEFRAYCHLFGAGDRPIDLTEEEGLPRKVFEDIYPAKGVPPILWPKVYKVMCIETAALVHHRLTKAARRVHEELLREINHRMLHFIKETPASLRAAFELDEMSVDKKRKLTELCDVDKETAAKRAKLLGQQADLGKLQDLMRVSADE